MKMISVTHSCGHECEYEISGTSRERERRVWYLEQKLCPACQEKADQEEEKERGLPDLEGSPKQIAWARSIRLGCFRSFDNESLIQVLGLDRRPKQVRAGRDYLMGLTSAHWWIDHREDSMDELLAFALEAIRREEQENSPAALQAKAEMVTMEPEQKSTETICTVEAREDAVYVSSERDETVRTTLKGDGFRWNGDLQKWKKECNQMTGSPLDRAMGIANALLRAGVRVRVRPEWVEPISSASFEPEHKKWIYIRLSDSNHFFLEYPEDRDIDKAIWDIEGWTIRGGYKAPNRAWRELEEFAEFHGFRISDGARKRMDALKASTVRVSPAAPQEPEDASKDVKDILDSSRDVLDDLKDED